MYCVIIKVVVTEILILLFYISFSYFHKNNVLHEMSCNSLFSCLLCWLTPSALLDLFSVKGVFKPCVRSTVSDGMVNVKEHLAAIESDISLRGLGKTINA